MNRQKVKQQQPQAKAVAAASRQYYNNDALYIDNFGFLDFGVQPSASYSFVQDLHRAKLESLRLQKEREMEQQLEKDFAMQLEMAQKESLEEQKKRSVALNRLEKRLSCPWNLKINPNTDDTGNCLFDSTADQLRRYEEFKDIDMKTVRKRAVDWLRAHPTYKLGDDETSETLEQWVLLTKALDYNKYCDEMAKDKVWGDEVTMIAICEEFQVRLFLWSSTVSESNYFSEHLPRPPVVPRRTILLCHVLELHYGSLHLNTSKDGTIVTNSNERTQQVGGGVGAAAAPSVPIDAQLRVLQALFATPKSGNGNGSGSNGAVATLTESVVARIAGTAAAPANAIGTLVDLTHGRISLASVDPRINLSDSSPESTNATTSTSTTTTATSTTTVNTERSNSTTSPDDDGFVMLVEPPASTACALQLKCDWHVSKSLLALYFDGPASESKPGDWIGLFDAGANARNYLSYWKTDGALQGVVTHQCSRSIFGQLEMRWMRANYAEVAKSGIVRHGPRLRMTARAEGDKLLITCRRDWQHCDIIFGATASDHINKEQMEAEQKRLWISSSDWLGLFAIDEANDKPMDANDDGLLVNEQPTNNGGYLASLYLTADDACCFDRPKNPGLYEVRFFSGFRRYWCLSRTRVPVD